MEEKFDMTLFLPKTIITQSNKNLKLINKVHEDRISIYYVTAGGNSSKKQYSLIITRFISKNKETFEVLGLLQAEMGKTQNGCLVFANSEPKIINKVIRWFEREFELTKDTWKWYIKVNIREPNDPRYKQDVEKNVINYWSNKTNLKIEQAHPKRVVYTITKHQKIKENFYGTLIIEFKNNIFSQIFKNFLKTIVYNYLLNQSKNNLIGFMQGIIAGEGCVQNDIKTGHYSVHLTAVQEQERLIYKECLKQLNINGKLYIDYKDLLISEYENLVQLLKQRLMTLHPRKYNKFLYMMKKYTRIKEETNYFAGKHIIWNKISKEKEQEIVNLYNSGITRTQDIAEKLGISITKTNRILRVNNLGKRLLKTPESLRKEVADYAKNNPCINEDEIAIKFGVSQAIVDRAYRKYFGYRGMKANCKC